MTIFNEYQYEDLRKRGEDAYAAAKYKIILDFLGRLPQRILNAGCGSGELSFLLSQAGHKVLGIDPSPEYIALARSRQPEETRARCDFLVSSIEDMPFDRQFDAVVAADVLEHIAGDKAAVAKLIQLTRPGGTVIVTVPAWPFLFGYHDEQLGHFRRYTKKTLNKVLAAAGQLEIKNIRYFGFSLIPVSVLYSKILREPYPISSLASGRGQWKRRVFEFVLSLERFFPFPLGTSLICAATRK